jgi:UPF0755 protein
MKRRRSILPLLFILFLGSMLCLVIAGAGWAYLQLPALAEKSFGAPGTQLSVTDRVVFSAQLFLNRNDILEPVNTGGKAVPFQVALGESVPSLADRLEKDGIIRSASAFRLYLLYSGLDTGVQAGEYQLSPALNTLQIAHTLQDATPTEVLFRILPGWRAEEIAAALPTSGLKVTQEEFLKLVDDPAAEDVLLPDGWPALKSLEGFLYPDSYRLKRDISAKEMVETFLKRFDEQIPADLREALSRQGYDLEKAVGLASIVQREAIVTDEQPIIASVFVNRLNSGMKLDSDPTVQYAIGYNETQKTWWTNPLTAADLNYNSSFNTYLYPGIPPGPICNPSLSAIQAVAYPAQTPYYYFRAKCDHSGRHSFAKTYDEHLQNGCP